MTSPDSAIFESYVPVYNTVPEDWEKARPMLVEALKMISNAVNIRQIGWLLDEEYLNGQSFIPGVINTDQYRSVLMKVVNMTPLIPGLNSTSHGITVDANFTLMNLYVSVTNPGTPIAATITGDPAILNINSTHINVTTAGAWAKAYAFVTYIQEL